ncbi:hypothetical protein LCGC14_0534810 [marine sediment metagenome]|uniref:Uncharacterized protein n=1 Tax=marine sediment metagenome TaxID=412755 RepID=A0A0F9RUP2_9ZZZZ
MKSKYNLLKWEEETLKCIDVDLVLSFVDEDQHEDLLHNLADNIFTNNINKIDEEHQNFANQLKRIRGTSKFVNLHILIKNIDHLIKEYDEAKIKDLGRKV